MDIIPESEGGCPFCKRRMATLLCDCPTSAIKTTLEFKEHRLTCDRPICENCATEIGNDVHFCPRCMKRLVKLADDREC